MRRALVLTVALLLLGCSDDDGASDPTTTTTSTKPAEPEPSAMALRGDGLGVVALGAAPDAAVAAVTAELGDPSEDPGWKPSDTCPGDQIRSVSWDGLVLLFTDGTTDQGTGQHLFTWRLHDAPPSLATVKGLGYGATADDAEELYPGHVERVPAEDPFPAFLTIDAEGGPITAYLDETDTITNLEAGTACGE